MSEENASTGLEKYLIYQLGENHFATPLIEVREVIEYRTAKPIPHTAPFFKGVINIRGEIVGVIDLRERLAIAGTDNPMALLVFETSSGPLAAIVDIVHSVTIIPEASLERRAAIHGQGADRNYFVGVGKIDDRLLTVVSLRQVLSDDQLQELPQP
ncbi:MAG TPA: chemotaxis protein CheW [Bdellovibrionales bacterium]|nr:chemotaxis protein CheW [Bdellovibrionales bacterium]